MGIKYKANSQKYVLHLSGKLAYSSNHLHVDRLKKVLGWWRVRDPGWQWTLDCRDPKPDNQIND